jgi:hypothetical protein
VPILRVLVRNHRSSGKRTGGNYIHTHSNPPDTRGNGTRRTVTTALGHSTAFGAQRDTSKDDLSDRSILRATGATTADIVKTEEVTVSFDDRKSDAETGSEYEMKRMRPGHAM